MFEVRIHLGLALVSLMAAGTGRAAMLLVAPAPPPTSSAASAAETSSQWLTVGKVQQNMGEDALAGEAYRKALESLPREQQVASEGARLALLSADAHWRSFEQDLDVGHLQAALDVLSSWIDLTGAQSTSATLVEVKWKRARVRAVRELLGDADTALADGKRKKAVGLYGAAADVLASQGYEWSLEARVVLRASAGCVAAYDRYVETTKDALG